MDRDAVRAFARRNREAVDESRRQHWARLYRERGAEAAWEAALGLRQRMSAVRPDWPTDEDRRADLAHHVDLKRKLDRAAHALARR
jgi:hypothetical protein